VTSGRIRRNEWSLGSESGVCARGRGRESERGRLWVGGWRLRTPLLQGRRWWALGRRFRRRLGGGVAVREVRCWFEDLRVCC
jgi:hypothetical protein